MCSVSASPMDLALKPDSISAAVASRAPMSPPRPATLSAEPETLPLMRLSARRTREAPRAVLAGPRPRRWPCARRARGELRDVKGRTGGGCQPGGSRRSAPPTKRMETNFIREISGAPRG